MRRYCSKVSFDNIRQIPFFLRDPKELSLAIALGLIVAAKHLCREMNELANIVGNWREETGASAIPANGGGGKPGLAPFRLMGGLTTDD